MKICFLIIGTNKYLDLAHNCAASIKQFVKIDNTQVDCILFTNQHKHLVNENLFKEVCYIDHLSWPLLTLLRYHNFLRYRQILEDYDYIYYIDSDMKIVDFIGSEILSKRVATLHPGQTPLPSHLKTFERNNQSTACINDYSYDKYYFNSLQGGSSKEFLHMCECIVENINSDLKNNYIASWHDESYANRYFYENPPTLELGPEFATVQKWNNCDKPKIICLEKDHEAIRQ